MGHFRQRWEGKTLTGLCGDILKTRRSRDLLWRPKNAVTTNPRKTSRSPRFPMSLLCGKLPWTEALVCDVCWVSCFPFPIKGYRNEWLVLIINKKISWIIPKLFKITQETNFRSWRFIPLCSSTTIWTLKKEIPFVCLYSTHQSPTEWLKANKCWQDKAPHLGSNKNHCCVAAIDTSLTHKILVAHGWSW